jgi:hypothetical protein
VTAPRTLDRAELRRQVVSTAGGGDLTEELIDYCRSPFELQSLQRSLPLADEPHVSDWRRYASAGEHALWTGLRERLVQLKVPIREGVSATDAYARTIRRGAPFDEEAFGGTAGLARPDALRLEIHAHPAGALPVLMPAVREDFETLYRALACHSEPTPVNPSVNAQMISGIVNWDRVATYRTAWEATAAASGGPWPAEMARVAARSPELFYDRVILLGRGGYSGIPAEQMGMTADHEAWVSASTRIRIEHEFTHYATKRLFGTMRLNLFDELLADCMGMAYALGAFRARWFLLGLGLGHLPTIDPRGRVHAYRAGLSDRAFTAVCAILPAAASRVEALTERFYRVETRGRFLLALADLTIELLASAQGEELFEESYARAAGLEGRAPDRPSAVDEGRA